MEIQSSATTPRKRGRKPKGRRVQISAKVPEEHKPLLEQAASDAGMPLCDFVATVLARDLGLSVPSYLEPAHKGQESLPISA